MTGTRTDAAGPEAVARRRFELAFERHHGRVLAYALRRCRTPEDAEDVAASTFAVAWRRYADLPEPESALPWLLGIARRVTADQLRGRRRMLSLLDRLRAQPVEPPGPRHTTAAAEALSGLRADDRELLRLIAWEGLSQAEAAVVLGVSANAVAIRLHRARKRFAAGLAKETARSRPTTPATGRTPREEQA